MKLLFGIIFLMLVSSCETSSVGNPKTTTTPKVSESTEFEKLWSEDQQNKQEKAAAVLNYLFNDSNPNDPNTAIIIENISNCNIIVRLSEDGTSNNYRLPIRKNSKNQFVIRKGNYTVMSQICNSSYRSQKKITETLILKLSN